MDEAGAKIEIARDLTNQNDVIVREFGINCRFFVLIPEKLPLNFVHDD